MDKLIKNYLDNKLGKGGYEVTRYEEDGDENLHIDVQLKDGRVFHLANAEHSDGATATFTDATGYTSLIVPYGGNYFSEPQWDNKESATLPIDFDSLRSIFPSFGMWERGGINYIKVVVDSNNPNCVIDILPVESGAGDKNPKPLPDKFGYFGYIVNGMFFYAKEIPLGECGEIIRVKCAENLGTLRVGQTQVSMIGENVMGKYIEPQLSQVRGKHVEGATVGSELGGSHFSLYNAKVLCGESRHKNRFVRILMWPITRYRIWRSNKRVLAFGKSICILNRNQIQKSACQNNTQ